MTSFAQHTLETAPEGSKPLLTAAKASWGFVPNLQATLAESPATLEAYEKLFELAGKASFTPAEQQVVFLTISVLHECSYCTAGHTYLARAANLPEDVIQALRLGKALADPRWQALRSFAEAVVRERGFVGDAALDTFIAAGFSRAQVLDVVLIAATKTISNYVNHIAHVPQESFMSDPALAWTPPSDRQSAA